MNEDDVFVGYARALGKVHVSALEGGGALQGWLFPWGPDHIAVTVEKLAHSGADVKVRVMRHPAAIDALWDMAHRFEEFHDKYGKGPHRVAAG